jgi:hypothetical protein
VSRWLLQRSDGSTLPAKVFRRTRQGVDDSHSSLQRRVRDLRVAAQHVAVHPRHYVTAGAAVLARLKRFHAGCSKIHPRNELRSTRGDLLTFVNT